MRFAGYAALFGKRDAGGDVIRKGAFLRSLSERKLPLPLFWQHRTDMRIGWVESIAEDAKGLRVIASIDNPQGGAAAALKQGITNGMSFGYRARGYLRDAAGRELTDIDLFEVSLVSHPMQHAARVHQVERAEERKFNQRHHEENGRFARVGEGRQYGEDSETHGGFRNGDGTMGRTRRVPSVQPERTQPNKVPPKPPTAPRSPTRKEIIATGAGRVQIQIRDNPRADASAPLHEVHIFEQVTQNDAFIRRSAQRHSVDPDLVRAIAYVETTHGYYDIILRPFDANTSSLPMNINTAYWGSMWGSRESLKNPATSIDAGTRMLRSIQMAMPGASIAKIATIYNDSNAVMVNSYGARVQAVYRAKIWQPRVEKIPTLK